MSFNQNRARRIKSFTITLMFFVGFLGMMLFSLSQSLAEEKNETNPVIKITDWSFYAAWGMSTLHHVTIENPTDVAYKTLKVKIDYYLSYYPTEAYSATVVIPVDLQPNSKTTYLEKGLASLIVNPNGIYGMHLAAGKIEVVEAIPETTIGVNL